MPREIGDPTTIFSNVYYSVCWKLANRLARNIFCMWRDMNDSTKCDIRIIKREKQINEREIWKTGEGAKVHGGAKVRKRKYPTCIIQICTRARCRFAIRTYECSIGFTLNKEHRIHHYTFDECIKSKCKIRHVFSYNVCNAIYSQIGRNRF